MFDEFRVFVSIWVCDDGVREGEGEAFNLEFKRSVPGIKRGVSFPKSRRAGQVMVCEIKVFF